VFSFPEAARALGIRLELAEGSLRIAGVSIDSRSLGQGELFVALPGARADGHAFLGDVFGRGAAGAVISKKYFHLAKDKLARLRNLLPVDDPAEALGTLAAAYRARFHLRAIGITGSVGKTTTKEFLAYLLGRKYAVLATRGNLNNHLGLPLTLFGLRSAHRFCVAELGANHLGEIRYLASILRPDAAILTKICPAHLEGFGSLEAVVQAKTELLEPLRKGSPAVIPDDDAALLAKAHRLSLKVVTVGFSEHADYQISVIEPAGDCISFVLNERKRFVFRSRASFLARNAAYAVAMAEQCGVSMEDLPEVWDGLSLPSGRFEEIALEGGVRIIFDGYNANPASFEHAVDSFCAMPLAGRRMMVFSDMLELGAAAPKYHEALGRHLAASSLHYVAAYGPMARHTIDAIGRSNSTLVAEYFESAQEAALALEARLEEGDGVLLKASRGMKVESVLEFLKSHPKTEPRQAPQPVLKS
jgi:UDP-N-acetylmuramoyl-tripeptide--D-alanyl-D-alanine ligase